MSCSSTKNTGNCTHFSLKNQPRFRGSMPVIARGSANDIRTKTRLERRYQNSIISVTDERPNLS